MSALYWWKQSSCRNIIISSSKKTNTARWLQHCGIANAAGSTAHVERCACRAKFIRHRHSPLPPSLPRCPAPPPYPLYPPCPAPSCPTCSTGSTLCCCATASALCSQSVNSPCDTFANVWGCYRPPLTHTLHPPSSHPPPPVSPETLAGLSAAVPLQLQQGAKVSSPGCCCGCWSGQPTCLPHSPPRTHPCST